MKDILVGVDGSLGSRHAVDRALRLGQQTGRPVRLVNVWAPPVAPASPLGAGYMYDTFQERADANAAARQLLDEEVSLGLARLATEAPVTVRVEEREGSTGHELAAAAESSVVAFVGTRGRGRIGNLLGSSIPHVLHRAPCPVLVVPARTEPVAPYPRVVVGVDGSEWSRAALLWAYELARLEHAELVAVHAVNRGDAPVHTSELQLWHKDVVSCLPYPSAVEVSVYVVPGKPDEVLVDSVGPHDLLVVGSRGVGAVAGMLLGSVSAACVAHPSVPVAVVKANEQGRAHLLAGPALAVAD